jgi:hypothetical protein
MFQTNVAVKVTTDILFLITLFPQIVTFIG